MILSFGLQEGLNQNKTALLITAVKYRPDFLECGTEILLIYKRISRSLNYRSLPNLEELLCSQKWNTTGICISIHAGFLEPSLNIDKS